MKLKSILLALCVIALIACKNKSKDEPASSNFGKQVGAWYMESEEEYPALIALFDNNLGVRYHGFPDDEGYFIIYEETFTYKDVNESEVKTYFSQWEDRDGDITDRSQFEKPDGYYYIVYQKAEEYTYIYGKATKVGTETNSMGEYLAYINNPDGSMQINAGMGYQTLAKYSKSVTLDNFIELIK